LQVLPAKEKVGTAKKRPAANLVMAFPAQMRMAIRRGNQRPESMSRKTVKRFCGNDERWK
jgi:hypothetical protein